MSFIIFNDELRVGLVRVILHDRPTVLVST